MVCMDVLIIYTVQEIYIRGLIVPPKKYSENYCRDCEHFDPIDVGLCSRGLHTYMTRIPVMPCYAQFGCRHYSYSQRNIYKGR